ncbi:hypothetical protein D3C75_792290 [compost metagenome]
MLVQVTHPRALGPFNLAVVRLELACDNIHEGGFSLAVGADQTDMLALQQPEGYVMENRAVSKAVA